MSGYPGYPVLRDVLNAALLNGLSGGNQIDLVYWLCKPAGPGWGKEMSGDEF